MSSDHRSSVRLLTTTLVYFKNDSGNWVGVLTDISRGGAHCTVYDTPVAPPTEGGSYSCTFVLPTGVVSAEVEVMWERGGGQTIGLKFTSIEAAGQEVLDTFCDSPF